MKVRFDFVDTDRWQAKEPDMRIWVGAGPVRSDGLLLFLRGARGLVGFRVHTAAPGPLNLSSQTEGGGQLEGYWLDLR